MHLHLSKLGTRRSNLGNNLVLKIGLRKSKPICMVSNQAPTTAMYGLKPLLYNNYVWIQITYIQCMVSNQAPRKDMHGFKSLTYNSYVWFKINHLQQLCVV